MTSHVLMITTAYEQGVGKGHQAYHRATETANPYADSECSEAWALGYKEGKGQAERLKQVEPVACLVRYRALRTPAAIAFDGIDHWGDWSKWGPSSIENGLAVTERSRNGGDCEYEMQPLYTHPQPAQQQDEPVAWQTVYQAVTKAIEQCKSASGTHARIDQLVNPVQITHDVLGTDTAST